MSAFARHALRLLLVWLTYAGAVARAEDLTGEPSIPAAAQPSKEQCVDANGKAQEERRQGKLAAARSWLRVCADLGCPEVVRDDCTRRLDELERAQPTIALSVQAADGSDLSDVTVRMDDQTLTTRLDGSAMPVDIGPHTFLFAADGYASLSRTWIVVEGEKLRRERVTLTPLDAGQPEPAHESAAHAASASRSDGEGLHGEGLHGRKLWGVIAGSAGAALLIGGLAFGLVASSRWDDADRQCPSHMGCSDAAVHDRDAAASYATASTVSLVTGGVLAALGLTLYLTAPKAPSVAVSVAPGGLRLRGAF